MSYPGHSLVEGSYLSAEVQLVCSTAPADWVSQRFCNILVYARFRRVYHVTETVQAVVPTSFHKLCFFFWDFNISRRFWPIQISHEPLVFWAPFHTTQLPRQIAELKKKRLPLFVLCIHLISLLTPDLRNSSLGSLFQDYHPVCGTENMLFVHLVEE